MQGLIVALLVIAGGVIGVSSCERVFALKDKENVYLGNFRKTK